VAVTGFFLRQRTRMGSRCRQWDVFQFLRFNLLVVCAVLLASCAQPRLANVPMDTRLDRADCVAKADTLVVLLPGVRSDPEEFVREGFVQALRQRSIAADVMLVDAHIGYYNDRSIIDRLDADVLGPARSGGYRAVWFVGISLGGFGALLHEEMVPGNAAGVVLLAPYLGDRPTSEAIYAAGGLRAWNPPAGALPPEKMDASLWRWLHAYAMQPAPQARPPLYLGYGVSDRYAFSHRLLAAVLPAERVFTTAGGHDWPAWRQLWQQALQVLPLPRCQLPIAGDTPR
jgi:pimeloyl-ACP methyl ester carboxylesterase